MDTGTFVVGAIVAAEIGFWVLLFVGLAARYLLKLRRLSNVLLVCVPLIDLVLIGLVAFDLSRGTEPTGVHGFAALYLGFSVGFGHRLISSVDAWFAHRFAGGPKPPRVPKSGPKRIRYEWREWLRILVAWAIAVAALILMKAFSGWWVPESMEELWNDPLWAWVGRVTLVNVIWLLTGPVYSMLFQFAPNEDARAETRQERELA
ncbi:hypothetical protein [Gulosibacter chungangensis]|uniref:Uncharacterized protein n=1 Tax=Gulosibacter chungangensis TaxID=979746 RepID=A0A7J5BDH5_9MICO|nr:hypothetical protein [Gulosibacter chungangensis]KAB1643926.1 hypothetical protein F8O05_03755 [Gulosibacter chungangensis]